MNTREHDALAPMLARRAVDLARDPHIPAADGAEHLERLAGARRAALEAARAELDCQSLTADVACAVRLVSLAIDRIDAGR